MIRFLGILWKRLQDAALAGFLESGRESSHNFGFVAPPADLWQFVAFPRKVWVMEIFPGIVFPWSTLRGDYFSQIKQNVNCTLISSCQMSNCKGNKELDMHQSSVKLKKFSNSEIPRLLMMGSHLDNKFSWEFHRVISNDNDNWYILWYHDAIKDWSELICKTIGSNLLNVIQILLKR